MFCSHDKGLNVIGKCDIPGSLGLLPITHESQNVILPPLYHYPAFFPASPPPTSKNYMFRAQLPGCSPTPIFNTFIGSQFSTKFTSRSSSSPTKPLTTFPPRPQIIRCQPSDTHHQDQAPHLGRQSLCQNPLKLPPSKHPQLRLI